MYVVFVINNHHDDIEFVKNKTLFFLICFLFGIIIGAVDDAAGRVSRNCLGCDRIIVMGFVRNLTRLKGSVRGERKRWMKLIAYL